MNSVLKYMVREQIIICEYSFVNVNLSRRNAHQFDRNMGQHNKHEYRNELICTLLVIASRLLKMAFLGGPF